jgi:hypothetical protein
MTSGDEAQQCAGHCEFVPTSTGEAVVALLTDQEAMGFELTKDDEDSAITHVPLEGGRMRIPSDERKQSRFRHATS